MKLIEIAEALNLRPLNSADLDREVTGGYVSDLLSDVMANSQPGNLWITLQTHLNIVAVASLKDLSGIVIINGRMPDTETIGKAGTEGIPLLQTGKPAFETTGMLYQILHAQDLQG